MTDWKVQKTINYLANLNVGLPDTDWDDFLSRKSAHDLAVKRHRRFLTAVISVPAAAAVLLLLFLLPLKKVVPENSLSQNNPPEPHVITDSIESHRDTITITTEPKVKPKDSVRVKVDERLKGKYAGAKVNTEVKPESEPKEKPEVKPEVWTGMTFGGATGFGGSTSRHYGSRMVAQNTSVNDTTKFNKEAYKLPEGTSVEDIIRKLPGVQIDSAGNITVNGKSVSRILVNGREFFNFDKSKPLTQLTAEMIEKVKAYEEQTVKTVGANVRPWFIVSDNPDDSASVQKYPLIVLDGEIVDVSDDKLAAFDFGAVLMDRYQLAELVGIRGDKIQAVRTINNKEAEEIWGEQGKNGVLEVLSRKYYRKVKKKGTIHGTKQPITDLKNKGEYE